MSESRNDLTLAKQRNTSEILSAYINTTDRSENYAVVNSNTSSNISSTSTIMKNHNYVPLYETRQDLGRLKRRRSAVTFPSTYRSLSSTLCAPSRSRSSVNYNDSVSHPDFCCYTSNRSTLGRGFRQSNNKKRHSFNQIQIRKSLEYVEYLAY